MSKWGHTEVICFSHKIFRIRILTCLHYVGLNAYKIIAFPLIARVFDEDIFVSNLARGVLTGNF